MLRLERLCTATGDQLPRRFKEEIKRELQRPELVLQMIKAIETERDAIASEKASTHTNAKKIQKFGQTQGVGAEFATVLVGEVFFRPFSNRHQIASYVGLTPCHFQSGSMSRDQGISKAGNPKPRAATVELAWMRLHSLPARLRLSGNDL
jgi:transposase